MKIVVNKCYGGFGLSIAGVKRYLELKGKELFSYKQTKYEFRDGASEYTKVYDDCGLCINHLTKDMGDKFSKFPEDEFYFSEYNIDRTDTDLVKTIEELGDKANGSCSKLSIVEIPDGVNWELDEYDGIESIHEVHRSW